MRKQAATKNNWRTIKSMRSVSISLIAISLLVPTLWILLPDAVRQRVVVDVLGAESLWLSTVALLSVSAITVLVLYKLIFTLPFSRMRADEKDIQSLRLRDPLTGLLNRDGLIRVLENAFEHRGELAGDGTIGLVMLDLDHFGLINKTLGEAVGDSLLKLVATRLQVVVRASDPLARIGGDQFVMVIYGESVVRGMDVMAANLQRAFDATLTIDSHDVLLIPSIGLAASSPAVTRPYELIACAEAAVRSAKAKGGARSVWYEASVRDEDSGELDVHVRLHHALDRHEFSLVYQPVMSADGTIMEAVEALLRWDDKARGSVSPAYFVPMLEQSGLITRVGRWVMHTACRQGREWIDAGANDLVMSVNVSPRQFGEPGFVREVESVLEETNFPADHLQLEITEGILLDPSRDCLRKLHLLSEKGIRFALDDFGMGYSSLAYLKHFPLHTLKIDRYFVKDLPGKSYDMMIARAIVSLGQGLGLHVTAEGVETPEQLHTLCSMGCDSIQGYLFSRPVSAARLSEMLLSGPRPELVPTPAARPSRGQPYRLQPVVQRVRIKRNNEVLGESCQAMWLLDDTGESAPTIYLPRSDVKVALGQTGSVHPRRFLGEQHYLDLVGDSGQVVSPSIAWEFKALAPAVEPLAERVAFNAESVIVEEMPLNGNV